LTGRVGGRPGSEGSNRPLLLTGAALAGAAALAHVAPGAVAWRRARCWLLPGLSGVGRPYHVALTFDDGPDPDSTPQVLDTLDALKWRATFFCLGRQAGRHPGLVGEIVARGHEVGVHGEDHRSHLRRSALSVVRDVRAARDRLEQIIGGPVTWFRPPYGAVAAPTLVAARSTGLRLVLWTTWGQDWKPGATGESVAAQVDRTWVDGPTVLLHDSDVTSAPGSWKATVAALPLLAGRWHPLGLEVGPLSEHF
jgi:peptidoglycan/xylan/chitin deacetylase (PgdA/CDA1 family)